MFTLFLDYNNSIHKNCHNLLHKSKVMENFILVNIFDLVKYIPLTLQFDLVIKKHKNELKKQVQQPVVLELSLSFI